jgi:hypothetical protein
MTVPIIGEHDVQRLLLAADPVYSPKAVCIAPGNPARGGRRDDSELTVFKSLGLAVENLGAAEHVLRRAETEGGVEVEF